MRILWDLIKPCRKQLANAEAQQKAALHMAQRALSDSEAAFRSASEKAVAELQARKKTAEAAVQSTTKQESEQLTQLQDRIKGWRATLDTMGAVARRHLDGQGVDVSSPPTQIQSGDPATDSPPVLVEECERWMQRLESQLKDEIVGSKPLRYWPTSDAARLALGIVLLMSIWMYGVGFVWFLAVYISRLAWIKEIDRKYRRFCETSQSLRADFYILERQAEKSAHTKISTAEESARTEKIAAEQAFNAIIENANQKIATPGRVTYAAATTNADRHLQEEIHKISELFSAVAQDLHAKLDALWKDSAYAGADWDSTIWRDWSPDPSPEFAARLGRFEIAAGDLRLPFPQINFAFALPALVPFSDGRCLLLSVAGKAKQEAGAAMLAVMVRVLANTPPGKARFTFIDPVGLGQNVADFMHLGDLNKDLISGKAWSEPQHIEQQLTVLTEHMETVIQTCLRNEFATIRDYNRERHEVAQPFRFLVINDFPVNFTEASARRLVSIVTNGPRCGVYTFILRDTDKKLPYGFTLSDLENVATKITYKDQMDGFVWQEKDFEDFTLHLDSAPPQDLTHAVVRKSGELAIPAMKIDVPFEKVLTAAALEKNSWWTASTAENLKVPLGPAGARAFQELILGGEQEAHALLVGRTGSGKTNLMHVIITALALKYPPQEVQLYLIDFKGGVGFKRYAEHRLPHAKVIAIESEREFGMSVLRGLDAEMKLREDTFRAVGVDSLVGYRAKMKSEKSDARPMPRILLVVDEFQEFFSENDDLSQQAKIIFERFARRGRSFGVHFLLATQSLSGSGQLPASIMGQIKVRIALPCSEADSRLILADDNKAARALSLPGEGIYNSMGGVVEGNNRFQVARFSDDDLPKYLRAVSESARNGHEPIIFEGNELAHVADCVRLKEALQGSDWPQTRSVEILLGEPIAIMPPVAAALRRQSGRNLMILTREENEGVGICIAAALCILSQQSPQKARLYIADFTTADSEWAGHAAEIAQSFPGQITVVNRQRDFPAMLASVAKEVQARGDNASSTDSVYLIFQGMHRIKPLREDTEDENGQNAVELLKTILRDGPEVGIHVISWADTWGNATRGLDRKATGEFGLRVAAVMDSGDSMNFLDSMAASKISKPHRALFYDEDRPGQFVMFRPYAMPPVTWLKETGQRLRGRIDGRSST